MSGPAPWLAEHRELLAALVGAGRPRALDVACGRGRNAAFLADLGFAVDAVDRDPWALAHVRERAPAVTTVHQDLEADPRLPRPPYAVIVCTRYLQRSLFAPMGDGLAPGGLLVLETFTRDHVDVDGHRMNPAYLLERNELLHAFPALRVLHYREGALAGLVASRE